MRTVLSFYREEPRELALLAPLLGCRWRRGWSSLRLACLDREHLERVDSLLELLQPPLAALQLVSEIRLAAPGIAERIYPVGLPVGQGARA
ncbi:MAG: hypothetical protein ACOYLI_05225 [Synechococcus lacustris]